MHLKLRRCHSSTVSDSANAAVELLETAIRTFFLPSPSMLASISDVSDSANASLALSPTVLKWCPSFESDLAAL
jgi:hypothetical protein